MIHSKKIIIIMGHMHSIHSEQEQVLENRVIKISIDDISVNEIEKTAIQTICKINNEMKLKDSYNESLLKENETEKTNKKMKILECRNKLLSELLKAETSNYDSLRKVADDLLLENKMLRLRKITEKKKRKTEDNESENESENENESDYDIDTIMVHGMMSLV